MAALLSSRRTGSCSHISDIFKMPIYHGIIECHAIIFSLGGNFPYTMATIQYIYTILDEYLPIVSL